MGAFHRGLYNFHIDFNILFSAAYIENPRFGWFKFAPGHHNYGEHDRTTRF